MAGIIAFEAQLVIVLWTKMQAGGEKKAFLPVKQINSPGFVMSSVKGKKKKPP